MALPIEDIRQDIKQIVLFRGDSGMSISVYADSNSANISGTSELDGIIDALESFYTAAGCSVKFSKKTRENDEDHLLYHLFGEKGLDADKNKTEAHDDSKAANIPYAGTIKITPKGGRSMPNTCPDADYPVAYSAACLETYFIYFFIKDNAQRPNHKQAFAEYLNPSKEKTRCN